MNNKILATIAGLALLSNLGLFLYYEGQADAQSLSKYQIPYDSKQEARNIIQVEEAKGCSKVNHDYTNKDGTQGILTFTCDSRDPPPITKTDITREDLLQEIANERNYNLIGRVIPP